MHLVGWLVGHSAGWLVPHLLFHHLWAVFAFLLLPNHTWLMLKIDTRVWGRGGWFLERENLKVCKARWLFGIDLRREGLHNLEKVLAGYSFGSFTDCHKCCCDYRTNFLWFWNIKVNRAIIGALLWDSPDAGTCSVKLTLYFSWSWTTV